MYLGMGLHSPCIYMGLHIGLIMNTQRKKPFRKMITQSEFSDAYLCLYMPRWGKPSDISD